jgi:hypothetical protein
MLLISGAVAPAFDTIATRLRLSARTVAAASACFVGVASMGVACHRFRNASFERSSLTSAWDGDDETRAIKTLIERGGRDHTMAIYLSWPWYGPTPQSMMLLYPGSAIAIATSEALTVYRNGTVIDERSDLRPIPTDVNKLLWVCEADRKLPASVFSMFPGTREVYAGRTTAVFLSELPERSVDALLSATRIPAHLD